MSREVGGTEIYVGDGMSSIPLYPEVGNPVLAYPAFETDHR